MEDQIPLVWLETWSPVLDGNEPSIVSVAKLPHRLSKFTEQEILLCWKWLYRVTVERSGSSRPMASVAVLTSKDLPTDTLSIAFKARLLQVYAGMKRSVFHRKIVEKNGG